MSTMPTDLHVLGCALRRSAAAMALSSIGFVGAAAAQGSSGIILDPSTSPLRCLVVPQAPLAYPDGAAAAKVGGVLRVRLTFDAADAAPRTEFLYDTVGGVFRDSVRDRTRAYRLPCMTPGDPVVATQEFAFLPGDGRRVVSNPVRDDSGSKKLFSCVTGMEKPPDYPNSSALTRSAAEQGTVVARFEFVAPDQPPKVEIVFDGGQARFARVVRDYVQNYRAPCLTATDLPLKGTQPFRFQMAGAPATMLKDISLATFVRSLDHLESQRVRVDFSTMACPFDVRFTSWRPYMDNVVGELERSDPNRREFVEWLRRVDLRIPDKLRPQVAGDAMTISVPCGVLDLL